jgi:hypothetical protein
MTDWGWIAAAFLTGTLLARRGAARSFRRTFRRVHYAKLCPRHGPFSKHQDLCPVCAYPQSQTIAFIKSRRKSSLLEREEPEQGERSKA